MASPTWAVPRTAGWGTRCRWAWRTRILVHLGVDLRMRLWQRAEDEAVRCSRPTSATCCWPRRPGRGPRWAWTRVSAPGSRSRSWTGPARWSPPTRSTRTSCSGAAAGGAGSPRWAESIATLARLAAAHQVELIAIGNGTASRETDRLAADLIKAHPELKLTKVMVSEAGASVYSASAYASRELPDMDVSLRGAVSIARRLQDPLAELVKIDPKSIGVGQYQHDLAEIKLSRSLDAVVEDCVNAVGVDVNTASVPLLARVSGISEGLAAAHRGPARRGRPVPQPPGAQGRAAAGAEGVRAVRGVPAHPGRRRPAGRVQRPPGGLSRGPADPAGGRDGHARADRQHVGAAVAAAAGVHRRARSACRP